jgi:hypothetical protein
VDRDVVLEPGVDPRLVTVGVCATTRSINRTPIWLSVAEAAITTTAMIRPNASTARPRLRPGTRFAASLPVVAAGTWFAARTDWVSNATAEGSSARPAF